MGRPRKQRRKAHGSAWHWRQTDCWYCTLPGTKKRMPLFDEQGERIRGKENQMLADVALDRVKVAEESEAAETTSDRERWLVAKVCSEYLQYCQRGVASGTISKGHHGNAASWLNDLCGCCGAMRVSELKKGHIRTWMEHPTWQSPATQRSVLSVVGAALSRATLGGNRGMSYSARIVKEAIIRSNGQLSGMFMRKGL